MTPERILELMGWARTGAVSERAIKREFADPLGLPARIRDVVQTAEAEERERCARVCEAVDAFNYDDPGESYANAIRAGGDESAIQAHDDEVAEGAFEKRMMGR